MFSDPEVPTSSLVKTLHLFPERPIGRAAFALIATERRGERCYLLQWNSKWGCYNFIGGKVEKEGDVSDDFAQTIRREIKEEMGIELERLLVAREIKQMMFWQFSEREKIMKPYHFAVFEIDFFPNLPVDRQTITRALRWLSSKHDNIYVSQEEILNFQTVSGKPISKTVHRILTKLGEI